jgi:hypothetical protein
MDLLRLAPKVSNVVIVLVQCVWDIIHFCKLPGNRSSMNKIGEVIE